MRYSLYMVLLLTFLACSAPTASLELTAESTDVPTVLRIGWRADDALESWVTWQTEDGAAHVTDGEMLEDGTWQALLLASAEALVDYQIFADGLILGSGDAETAGERLGLELEEQGGRLGGATATTALVDDVWTSVILDGEGQVRWWLPLPEDGMTSLRTWIDDEGVWVSRFTTDFEKMQDAHIDHYSFDGELLETVVASRHHHDFLVHDDGTLVWIAFDVQEIDGAEVYGDTLVRRVPGEEPVPFCSTWQLWPASQNQEYEDGDAWSWSNHLAFDGTNYWLSLHSKDVVMEVSPDCELLGILGDSSAMQGEDWIPSEPFRAQHGGTPTPDGTVLLHDNDGYAGNVRIVEYALDDEAGTADLVWSYEPEDSSWRSPALGDAIRDPDGTTRISWGVFGALEQADETGAQVGYVGFSPGTFLGYLTPVTLD